MMKHNQSPQAKQQAALGLTVRIVILFCLFVYGTISLMVMAFIALSGPVSQMFIVIGVFNVIVVIASSGWLRNINIANYPK
jgi:hypothetical protein